jgi:flagellar hook-associated protein 3 FlgL
MTTLSTLGQNRLVRSEMAKLQLDINRLQQQITSGKKTDRYGDLGALAPLDISLRNKGEQLDNFKTNIQTLKARTDIIDNTLGAVRQTVLDLRNAALTGKMFDTGRADITSRATAAIGDVMQKLQANVDGRFLFSGVSSDHPPMADVAALIAMTQTAVNTALATPLPDVKTAVRTAVQGVLATTTNFYEVADPALGGGVKHAAPEIDEGIPADYSITGNDPAFVDMLEGLLMLATLPAPQDDPVTPPNINRTDWDDTADSAGDVLTDALTGIETLQLQNGRVQALLDSTEQNHNATLTIIQTQINDIEQVDLVDASTRMTQLRTQLEASFSVTADLRTLSLVNYLR